ncbi:MAG: hypothetical protein IKC03_02635, partial [Oscillospiraceae bacterium]|nr:hypothetical protein [Oscillospiraceae bacterium]
QLPVKQEQAESGASDVVRLEKQLESLMEESTIQEQESRSVVYQLAQKACDQVDPAEYETEKIQRTLRSRTPVEQLDVHLLRTCVEKVQVFRDGQIRLILGNGQTVKRS